MTPEQNAELSDAIIRLFVRVSAEIERRYAGDAEAQRQAFDEFVYEFVYDMSDRLGGGDFEIVLEGRGEIGIHNGEPFSRRYN